MCVVFNALCTIIADDSIGRSSATRLASFLGRLGLLRQQLGLGALSALDFIAEMFVPLEDIHLLRKRIVNLLYKIEARKGLAALIRRQVLCEVLELR